MKQLLLACIFSPFLLMANPNSELPRNIISIEEACQYADSSNTIFEESAIHIPAGTKLKSVLSISGNMLEMLVNNESEELLLKDDLFLCSSDEQLWLSLDGLQWKELTEFYTGMFQVQFAFIDNEAVIQLALIANTKT